MTYPSALKTAGIGFGNFFFLKMTYPSACESAGIGTAYASAFESAGIGCTYASASKSAGIGHGWIKFKRPIPALSKALA